MKETREILENMDKYIDHIREAYPIENMSTISICLKTLIPFVESIFKIPFLTNFLDKSVQISETSMISLVDTLDRLLTESRGLSTKAERDFHDILRGTDQRKGFDETITDSHKVFEAYKTKVSTLLRLTNEHSQFLSTLESDTQQIDGLLSQIYDLSEASRVIALNLSIEISKYGNKNSSLLVISKEIQRLNAKINDVANGISAITKSFAKTNQHIKNNYLQNSKNNIFEIEEISDDLANNFNQLTESYETSTALLHNLTGQISQIHEIMNQNLIESLQFQDITKQQIQDVIDFLKEIYDHFHSNTKLASLYHLDSTSYLNSIEEKTKKELLLKVKTKDERLIIQTYSLLKENYYAFSGN